MVALCSLLLLTSMLLSSDMAPDGSASARGLCVRWMAEVKELEVDLGFGSVGW